MIFHKLNISSSKWVSEYSLHLLSLHKSRTIKYRWGRPRTRINSSSPDVVRINKEQMYPNQSPERGAGNGWGSPWRPNHPPPPSLVIVVQYLRWHRSWTKCNILVLYIRNPVREQCCSVKVLLPYQCSPCSDRVELGQNLLQPVLRGRDFE